LRGADRYCAVCGLPQLVYVAADVPQATSVEPVDRRNGRGVGLEALTSPDGIVWRPALNAALTVAVPVGILCSGAYPLGALGIVAGAAWAVSLYARWARPVDLSASTGARIGLVTGLLASWLMIALVGGGLWISRFILHDGGDVDSVWAAQADKVHRQLLAQPGSPSPESIQMAQRVQEIMLSAQGRAEVWLFGMMFLAAALVLLAVAGGTLGAKLASMPRRPVL